MTKNEGNLLLSAYRQLPKLAEIDEILICVCVLPHIDFLASVSSEPIRTVDFIFKKAMNSKLEWEWELCSEYNEPLTPKQ